ncbi:hypothetical protein R1flu_025255 [Riccia fluitans]|uniref:Uncharacterized protein n=1 Tax=Riccia fluitans TaxID=41844 RepID=A0ABD1XY47_9MARC
MIKLGVSLSRRKLMAREYQRRNIIIGKSGNNTREYSQKVFYHGESRYSWSRSSLGCDSSPSHSRASLHKIDHRVRFKSEGEKANSTF